MKLRPPLRLRYDHVLIAEWLAAPPVVAALGDALCFAHELRRERRRCASPTEPGDGRVRGAGGARGGSCA